MSSKEPQPAAPMNSNLEESSRITENRSVECIKNRIHVES